MVINLVIVDGILGNDLAVKEVWDFLVWFDVVLGGKKKSILILWFC